MRNQQEIQLRKVWHFFFFGQHNGQMEFVFDNQNVSRWKGVDRTFLGYYQAFHLYICIALIFVLRRQRKLGTWGRNRLDYHNFTMLFEIQTACCTSAADKPNLWWWEYNFYKGKTMENNNSWEIIFASHKYCTIYFWTRERDN